MSNPVFDRINNGISKGEYAGFGQRAPQRGANPAGPAQYGQYASQGQMSADNLNDLYNAPSAGPTQTGRLTADDVIMKALGLFGLMLVMAVGTWFVTAPAPGLASLLMIGGIVVTLVLGLVIAFKKTVSVPLIVAYAAVEGVLVGAVSMAFQARFPGAVMTAVVATLCVFVAMFAGWKIGFIKVTDKSRRIFGMAILGYLLFAVANLAAAWIFGANSGWGFFGFGSPMSIIISVVAVGLASYSLAMDFDSIDRVVAAQLPEKYSWLLAHGLIVTVVWLYLEILRLVAQLQGRD